jgi:hypothetical protein
MEKDVCVKGRLGAAWEDADGGAKSADRQKQYGKTPGSCSFVVEFS